jgi:CrcB protein
VETWTKVIVLSIGGTLGVNARYWLGAWMSRWASPQFPWATFAINISGSFLIGFLTVALTRWVPHPNVRLLVITGFLGGYTTFSTFENDSLTLWERGEGLLMVGNLIGSVAVGFVAVLLGTALGRGLDAPPNEQAAVGPRGVETTVAGPFHSARYEGSRSITAGGDGFDVDGDHRGTDDGGP